MDKYDEIECIGRGNYGCAYLVKDIITEEKFVVKKIPLDIMTDKEIEQAHFEVELLSKLNHPNIVAYKENFRLENSLHIVMAYCQGGDLSQLIKGKKGENSFEYFSEEEILNWFIQMVFAIQYLHDQRILHRDLKTSNIFLTTDSTVKLGDFGIARVLDSTLDQAKTVVGTPYYMSPEVCESKPYSYSSDIWALGCVLYEMCALQHAFKASNLLGLVFKIVQQKQPPIPDHFSTGMKDLVDKLLRKEPEERPSIDAILATSIISQHIQSIVVHNSCNMFDIESSLAFPVDPILSSTDSSGHWPGMKHASTITIDDDSSCSDSTEVCLRYPERSCTPEPLLNGEGSRLFTTPHCPKQLPDVGIPMGSLNKYTYGDKTGLNYNKEYVCELSNSSEPVELGNGQLSDTATKIDKVESPVNTLSNFNFDASTPSIDTLTEGHKNKTPLTNSRIMMRVEAERKRELNLACGSDSECESETSFINGSASIISLRKKQHSLRKRRLKTKNTEECRKTCWVQNKGINFTQSQQISGITGDNSNTISEYIDSDSSHYDDDTSDYGVEENYYSDDFESDDDAGKTDVVKEPKLILSDFDKGVEFGSKDVNEVYYEYSDQSLTDESDGILKKIEIEKNIQIAKNEISLEIGEFMFQKIYNFLKEMHAIGKKNCKNELIQLIGSTKKLHYCFKVDQIILLENKFQS